MEERKEATITNEKPTRDEIVRELEELLESMALDYLASVI